MSQFPTALALGQASFGGSEGPDFTRYLVICGLIVLTVAGIGFGFRKLIGGTLMQRAAARSLSIIDVLPMGGKKRLCVVRCYDRTFVLGQGEKEISFLAELDPSDVPTRIIPAAPIAKVPVLDESAQDTGRFEEVLEKARERMRLARSSKQSQTTSNSAARPEENGRPAPGVDRSQSQTKKVRSGFESLA